MSCHGRLSLAAAAAVSLGVWGASHEVSAQSLQPCGNIDVEANAQCEVTPPSASCDVQCEPVRLRAACAANLYASCEGQCDGELSADCRASCETDCQTECTAQPGQFSCSAYCEGGCDADCSAECEGSNNQARCEASCQATCQAQCDAGCDVSAPEVDCETRCESACTGQCKAEARLDCQVDCQADRYAECEAELQGGCMGDCMTERGALFCDGQYVDHGDNLDMCVAALRERLDIEVDGYAEADASCDGGTCMATADAGASSSCNVPGGAAVPTWPALLGFAGWGVWMRRRRRAD